jgi:hypothetical protein
MKFVLMDAFVSSPRGRGSILFGTTFAWTCLSITPPFRKGGGGISAAPTLGKSLLIPLS